MFAKLFNTSIGQILVKKDSGDDGPEVRLYFKPKGLGVCSVSMNWSEKDEATAWERVDRIFDTLDEEKCFELISKTINNLELHGLTDNEDL